ncbi:hypothetical protein C1924_05220 [Stenotrophomonas sp. ESTM1D_MKCIP4_1]|uniref:hypothetical protein n=1 Tax=Stenotrophomonas sp. ESTM1D_MKCIP4_1 TaxID=2072414 RepID=UPI000D53FB64|nr:hypothetical protein [Stenotrophomonas sp. ESTM1D_MKCIP4_1]AWH52615.1 hypothetical protein C1924_05220 [Stenotrophomonas sp. ESTM1D_MKCIP4_1]
MRSALLLMASLTVLGCSNPGPPDTAAAMPPNDGPATDAGRAPAATRETPALAASGIDPLYGAVAVDAETPSRLLNRYVLDLLNGNKAGIDAAWALAPPDARRADDAALRLLPDVHTLRLDAQTPLPRDQQQPPRLLEVPVRIRATTSKGQFRYHGWYRVQPRADGQGWQIHSAQLQPTLD